MRSKTFTNHQWSSIQALLTESACQNFGGHKSFCGATDTPVLNVWWRNFFYFVGILRNFANTEYWWPSILDPGPLFILLLFPITFLLWKSSSLQPEFMDPLPHPVVTWSTILFSARFCFYHWNLEYEYHAKLLLRFPIATTVFNVSLQEFPD